MIVVDDAGFMDFGGYGGEARTPSIDAIADAGVRFTNYHTSPLCAPSRAMLLTGIDNHRTGVGTIPEVVTEEQAERHGVNVEASEDAATAVSGADIVCTTTSATEPVLFADMLEPGMHINAVGASIPSWRELETCILPLVTLFTDRRQSLANEAGEFIDAVETGLIPAGLVVPELGEVLNGDHPGRTSATEITLFRSLGLAVEDIAAADLVHRRAVDRGVGTMVELDA